MLSGGRFRLAEDTAVEWDSVRSICRAHNGFVGIFTFPAWDGQGVFAYEAGA